MELTVFEHRGQLYADSRDVSEDSENGSGQSQLKQKPPGGGGEERYGTGANDNPPPGGTERPTPEGGE